MSKHYCHTLKVWRGQEGLGASGALRAVISVCIHYSPSACSAAGPQRCAQGSHPQCSRSIGLFVSSLMKVAYSPFPTTSPRSFWQPYWLSIDWIWSSLIGCQRKRNNIFVMLICPDKFFWGCWGSDTISIPGWCLLTPEGHMQNWKTYTP